MKQIKQCTKCKNWFPATEEYFYKQKINNGYKLTPDCKKCRIKRNGEYQHNNLNEVRKRQSIDRANNPEYHRKKKERYLENNYEEKVIKEREWRQNHPEKVYIYNKKHYKKKHKITEREWENCKKYFNYSCAYCGMTEKENKKLTKKGFHKEHIIDDGRNDLKNCVPSCKSCNSSKKEQSFNNWYNEKNPKYSHKRYYKIYLWIRFDCKKFIQKKKYKSKKNIIIIKK